MGHHHRRLVSGTGGAVAGARYHQSDQTYLPHRHQGGGSTTPAARSICATWTLAENDNGIYLDGKRVVLSTTTAVF